MALLTKRKFSDTMLALSTPEQGMYSNNHIFEPEFHQDKYVAACEITCQLENAFQVGDSSLLQRPINRGTQPHMQMMKTIRSLYVTKE